MKVLALSIILPLGTLFALPSNASPSSNPPENTQEHQAASHKDTLASATHYINQLAKGEISLSQDTAISSHCGIQRRKVIREQLDFLRKTHFNEGDTFTLETQKFDGDFAAVLLRSENLSTPLTIRIHALALIRKKGIWRTAPLPGNFANTGYGYDKDVEKTVRSLERWMASEKVTRESKAKTSAEDNLLSSILKEEKAARLDMLTKNQAVLQFIKQCREKNLLAVLARMGGGSKNLDEPLETIVNIISQGLTTKDTANDWLLVTNPSVIIQPMGLDKQSKEVAIGFWNPLVQKKAHVLYFPTHQSDGKIFVKLPHPLRIAMLPKHERWQQQWQHRHENEEKLKQKLPSTLLKNHPKIKFPDDNQQLTEKFIQTLNTLDFAECIRLLPRSGEYFGEEDNQHHTLTQLSNLWHDLYRLKSAPRDTLTLLEEDKLALLPLQYAKVNRPGEFQIIKIWLLKDPNGWHILPEETLHQYADKKLTSVMRQLETKMRSMAKEQKEKYSRSLMDKVVTITPPLTLDAAENDAAEKTLTHFRLFLRSRDTASALAKCAVLKGTSNTKTLKSFNYAIRGAADHSDADHILGISRTDKWLGLSLRTESKTSGIYDYPLYLVANTEQGPKIILDIDLRHATNKGRKLLNNRNWSKLEKALPKESYKQIQTIFEKHEKLSTADIKASEPLRD